MSAITIGGDLVHYEKLGRGRPAILVHGWIGSWRYWIPVMSKLHTKYSVYTLDLIGYGDSAKNERNYSIKAQVKMLEQFMDQLGIPKAAFIGHGLGAMIITQFALEHPTKVARALLASIPLFDPGDLAERTPAGTRKLLTGGRDRYSLAPSVEEVTGDKTIPSSATTKSNNESGLYTPFHELPTIGKPDSIDRDKLRQAALERDKAKNKPNQLLDTFKDYSMLGLLERCFKKNEAEFDKLKADVVKSDDKVLTLSSSGFEAGTMLDDLRRVTAPIVAVHGMQDPIIPAPSEEIWNYLTLEKEDVFLPIPLPNVRHFPMLEHEPFIRLTNDFLDTAEITNIEVRERWRRRSR